VLDAIAIYEKGLADLSELDGVERLVFMLQDFDNLMDMEGWDHFFLHESHFAWYPEMKDWLHTIGDTASLAVLTDYEAYLKERLVRLSPSEIERFLSFQDNASMNAAPDWRHQYSELKAARWAKALAYLESQDVGLSTAEGSAPPG